MQEFARIQEKLDKQCSYHCRHLGHLRGLIDNDDWVRVVDGSMTGRVLLLGNSEITNALVLFNTRMLDDGNDTITVHKLSRNLPDDGAIEGHHRSQMERVGIDYDLERYYATRAAFVEAYRTLRKSSTRKKLKSLRDFRLAHYIEPETEPDRATLFDLLDLTEAVNELVGMAGYIVNGAEPAYRDFAKRAEKETRMLYAALPPLVDIEPE